jgi:hypothetical protein
MEKNIEVKCECEGTVFMHLSWREFSAGTPFNGNHLLLYRRGLDKRYGAGTGDALEERSRDSHFKGKTAKERSKEGCDANLI